MLKYVKLNPMYGLRISHSLSEALSRTRIAIWKQLWFRSLCECTTSSVYLSCSFPLPPSCQPVLHSCCSNPLRLLPALWSRSEHPSPFSPLSFFFFSIYLFTLLQTLLLCTFPLPQPFHRYQSLRFLAIKAALRFSRSRLELMKHCGALPTAPCVRALC